MDVRGALRARGRTSLARLLRSRALRGWTSGSRRFGPPRRTALMGGLRGDDAERFPGTAAYAPDWSGLRYDDGTAVAFATPLPTTFPARDVVRLRRGRVLSEHGWSVTARDEVLLDAAFVHEQAGFRYYETDMARRPLTELRGHVLNLTSTWANVNYGHALLDAVSRLSIVAAAGLTTDAFDWFLVPGYRSAEVDFVLDRAGVPPERRIRVAPATHVEASDLWVTGFPGVPRCYPRYVPEFLRGLLTDDERQGGDRIWLSRSSGKRALANHAEAEALVRSYGYEPWVPAADGNALLTLARASSVVGTHGAALSSIAVSAPGTHVVEILPSGHRYPYFATLAASAGHVYRAIPGESVSAERDADFTVDLGRLEASLQTAPVR